MYLAEYEAKRLLAQSGLNVPQGIALSLTESRSDIAPAFSFPLVVKAQVPTGRRGKLGGVVIAEDTTQVLAALKSFEEARFHNYPVKQVLLEEYVQVERELYVSLILDRDRRQFSLLASPRGGVDIESESATTLRRWPISQLLGITSYVKHQIANHLHMSTEQSSDLNKVLEGVYSFALRWGATLVEINPLALIKGGSLIALDAKITLDDSTRIRWNEPLRGLDERTPFEQAIAELNLSGIELPAGDVAIITSGAGVGMATMDCVAHFGGKVKAFVDMGGIIIRDHAGSLETIRALQNLVDPRVYLFNFFFQLADSKVLAGAIHEAFQRNDATVVARFRGKNETEAREIVSNATSYVTSEFTEACRWAAEL